VHRDFLDAGADCLITSTYQASLTGFARLGLDTEAGAALMRVSVDLAREARRAFLDADDGSSERPRPLVAAGIGPYGAFLADGSEYTGRYDLDDAGLRAFHRDRWRILAASPADLLACETIPSLREAAVLLSLLADTPDRWAWLSFSCRDGIHLNDGTRFDEAVALCAEAPRVAAVGVNCTAPDHVASLIAAARRATDLPIIVYPNSGETYEAVTRTWRPGSSTDDWDEYVREWYVAGARGVGGCCRVGPRDIARIRRVLGGCARG
jgi:homocysteine S-methyltransferase